MHDSTACVESKGMGYRMVFRIVFYAVGLLIMAFGVTFSANSNLGMSPVNSIPAVMSAITNIEMGNCVIVIFSLFIVVQILIKRRQFKLINLTQLIFSTLFGKFVDLTALIVGDFALPGFVGQIVMMLLSVVMIAIGVSLYVGTNLINMPMEGMTLAITEQIRGKTFRQVKIVVDSSVVILALILTLIFMGTIQSNLGINTYPTSLVYIGTVASAVLVGLVMGPVQKVLIPPVHRICFGAGRGQ